MNGADARHTTDLAIEGMTCTACARRIERSLAGADGHVEAHVNVATATARVEHGDEVDVAALVERVRRAGYGATPVEEHADGAHHDHGGTDDAALRPLRWRFALAAPLSAALVAFMAVPALRFDGWEGLALALGTPVALVSAWPLHRAALRGARHGAATMDTLVSIGVLAAWGWSLGSLLAGGASHGESYVEVAAVTTTLVLGGRLLEARARRRAGDALRSLLRLAVREARVLGPDGKERAVPAEQLAVDDRIVVRPGERVPADGIVESGASSVDRSLVTGESVPVHVEAGDEVIGGSQNVDGRLVVRATKVGADTTLAQVARLVTEAQLGRANVQRLADRVSGVFVPIVLALSALTFAGWMVLDGSTTAAVSAAIAVLIVACPCALGLATPTALLVGTGRGAQLGIVIRGPEVLERARSVDSIVLDKTGTVTSGRFEVVEVLASDERDGSAALELAAAVEIGSEHPIGAAIVRAAGEHGASRADVGDFRSHAGLGVEGTVDGRRVLVGTRSFLDEQGVSTPAPLDDLVDAASPATFAWVAVDGAARAALALRDEPRADSAAAVAALRELGLEVVLATGDGDAPARQVADAVGITDVRSELRPQDKVELVRTLQRGGARVAMVGDGINDAPALAGADLGIAIGTGTDVAIEASDVTLVSPSLWAAVDSIRLARATLRRIRRNLFWAFAYNVAALPLAMAGLLEPMIAGGAMAASSLFVVVGSLSLRRFRAQPR